MKTAIYEVGGSCLVDFWFPQATCNCRAKYFPIKLAKKRGYPPDYFPVTTWMATLGLLCAPSGSRSGAPQACGDAE